MSGHPRVGPVAAWRLLDIPLVRDGRGSLCFTEANHHVPFPIKRVYWIHAIPSGAQRGCHAHRSVQELIIAVAGAFDVHCDDGSVRQTIHLDDPAQGLLLACDAWRELDGFSPDAVCLVLASGPYAEEEYVRDYLAFATFRDPE